MSLRGHDLAVQIGDGATGTPTIRIDPRPGSVQFNIKKNYGRPEGYATDRGAATRARALLSAIYEGAFDQHLIYECPAFLKYVLGSVATVGASAPYTHTFRWPVGGTPAAFAYEVDQGDDFPDSQIMQTCRVTTATISIPMTDFGSMTANLTALSATASATKTALSESTTRTYLRGNDCTVLTLNSVDLLPGGLVQSLTFNLDNNVETKYGLGSSDPAASNNLGRRTATAEIVLHVTSGTQDDYQALHVAGTEVALVATFTSGSESMTFNLRGGLVVESAVPIASDPGLVELTVSIEARQTTSADAFDVVVVNPNSSAIAN